MGRWHLTEGTWDMKTYLFLNSGPVSTGTYHAVGENAATYRGSELTSPISIYSFILFYLLLCLIIYCWGLGAHATVSVWWSEDTLQHSVLSFHLVGPRD